MGAIDFLKKIFVSKSTKSDLKVMDFNNPRFSVNASPNSNSTFMAACETHARHGSKLRPQIMYEGMPSKQKKHLNYLLTVRPNEVMNAPTFWERVTLDYHEYSNSFVYIEKDYSNIKETIQRLWIIPPNNIEFKYSGNQIYFKFKIRDIDCYCDSSDMIHLAKNTGHLIDGFGKIDKSISKVLELIATNYEGLKKSIVMSAFIRFLVSTPTLLNDSEKKKRAQGFAEAYLGNDSASIAYLDAAENVVQLDTSKGKYAGAEVMTLLDNQIYNYLGINTSILQATYNEDDYQSYYESSIEPLALKIETELIAKILTQGERDHGSTVVVDANRLQTASLKTRAKIAEILQKSPIHRPNDVNKLLYQNPIENGDTPFIFLNYSQNINNEESSNDENENNNEEKTKDVKKQ